MKRQRKMWSIIVMSLAISLLASAAEYIQESAG